MKGFAILFAILGCCIQYANTSVTGAPIHNTNIEVTANSSPIEGSENDYVPPTAVHKEDDFLTNSELAPRGKAGASSQSDAPLYEAVCKCMYAARTVVTWPTERERRRSAALTKCIEGTAVVAIATIDYIRNTFVRSFGSEKFPNDEYGESTGVYPPTPDYVGPPNSPGRAAR